MLIVGSPNHTVLAHINYHDVIMPAGEFTRVHVRDQIVTYLKRASVLFLCNQIKLFARPVLFYIFISHIDVSIVGHLIN